MTASAGQLLVHAVLVGIIVAAVVVLAVAGKISGDQAVGLIVAAGGLGGIGTVGVFRGPPSAG